jgi:hypothetical protein
MPQLLAYLEADAGDTEFLESKTLVTKEDAAFVNFDWGTLAVYSCPNSCERPPAGLLPPHLRVCSPKIG